MLNILLLDVETAPSKGYIWSLWKEVENFSFIERDWYILCWSAKWLEAKDIMSSSLPDFKSYKRDPESDKEVLLNLWKLLDTADVIIAHNGINFDRKKINARFIINGIKPPSPYRVIDTLEVCRKEFAFTSNRLNDVAQFLNLGKKAETGGFQLWKNCLEGDRESWKKMVDYCKNDIILLEKVYFALRPFILQHPNLGVDEESLRPCCPKCASDNIHYRGYSFTNMSKFKRFCCMSCGGWGRLKLNILDKEKKASLTANA